MIPNHSQFILALQEKRKVWVRFSCKSDDQVREQVFAPLKYGSAGEVRDGIDLYWLWDNATLGLSQRRILDFHLLDEVFDPAHLHVRCPILVSAE